MKKLLLFIILFIVLYPYQDGDLNRDSKVTVTDLVIMRRMVEGVVKPTPFADLNFDDKVDIKDLQILRARLAGRE